MRSFSDWFYCSSGKELSLVRSHSLHFNEHAHGARLPRARHDSPGSRIALLHFPPCLEEDGQVLDSDFLTSTDSSWLPHAAKTAAAGGRAHLALKCKLQSAFAFVSAAQRILPCTRRAREDDLTAFHLSTVHQNKFYHTKLNNLSKASHKLLAIPQITSTFVSRAFHLSTGGRRSNKSASSAHPSPSRLCQCKTRLTLSFRRVADF